MTTDLSAERKLDDETLAQMQEDASRLAALDEAEDVALEIYRHPFAPATHERALKWLQSQRHEGVATPSREPEPDGPADA